jgi:hypothetical protein
MNARRPGKRRVRAVLVVLAVLAATGTVALALSRSPDDPGGAPLPSAPAQEAFAPPDIPPPATAVEKSGDPDLFARDVAMALFTWDTTLERAPGDVAQRLVKVADPTGAETAALLSDLAAYLPHPEMWRVLRGYSTRQWLELRSVTQPQSWADAADSPGILPGTAARTVDGVRHRTGVWEGREVHTQHDVSFTAFIACAPTYKTCRLLRLSILDKPLS